MVRARYLSHLIAADLKEKMVFLGGPRQVGKTTLAKLIGSQEPTAAQSLNWDHRQDRRLILDGRFNAEARLLIFDELHKYRQWKNYLKGLFDTHRERFRILVTGSARLDLYRRGGDSLLGRYHYFRLHPFSLAELLGDMPRPPTPFAALPFDAAPEAICQRHFDALLRFGGFPEPLLKHDERTLRRWHNERIERLVKEDIRDVEVVRDLSALQILSEVLPSRVGSKLSLNALREDLQVAHKTIASWVEILERFYYHFRLHPFQASRIRSLRKEAKLYLWDWSLLEDPGVKLENLIASHLLKFTHFLHDAEGYRAELSYLGDVEGREVDFLVTNDRKPWFAVEVKTSDQAPSKALRYFAGKLRIPFVYQVVNRPGVDVVQDRIRIMSAARFCSGLV